MGNTQLWNPETGRERTTVMPPPQRQTAVLGQEERRTTEKTGTVLILDGSSSHSENLGNGDARSKMDGVKESVTQYVVNAPTESWLGIVVFQNAAWELWLMQQIGSLKLDIIRAIQSIEAKGTTAMAHALHLAAQQLRNVPGNYLKRAYLLSDGMPDSDPSREAEELKKQAVQLQCIGFGSGMEIDEALLRNMASIAAAGEPLYYHFRDAAKLTGFLKRESKIITR